MHRPKILVVDDDREVLAAMVKFLEKRGYEVAGASSAGKVLDLIHDGDGAFDLLITDLAMPGMDGLGLLKELSHRCPELPVILITGHGDADQADTARHLGASEVLSKPATGAALLASVENALHGRTVGH